MTDQKRHCVREGGKCGDKYCGKPKGEACIYEYVHDPASPLAYSGADWPPPRRDVRLEALEEFVREEARRMEDLAAAMRNPERASKGLVLAYKIADAFERSAQRHREILEALTST